MLTGRDLRRLEIADLMAHSLSGIRLISSQVAWRHGSIAAIVNFPSDGLVPRHE